MPDRLSVLSRSTRDGITLVEGEDGPVSFAFTERTGGVSQAPFASLNLGAHVGDDPAAVQENRRRVLAAMGAESDLCRLLVPNQVHGNHVACIRTDAAEELARVREDIAEGADAIVCTAPHVPVMLCFADCAPVVLTCPGGFAVVHSGWKGTLAKIAGESARVLCEETGASARDVRAYIGPHILGDEYEVSEDLMQTFSQHFDNIGDTASRLLDLSEAIRQSLEEVGVPAGSIVDPQLSTMAQNDRFFSYRKESGVCGRHAAVAIMGETDGHGPRD